MADRSAMRGGRWWILAVIVGVPAALAVIWLLRTAPPTLGCEDDAAPGRQLLVEPWLAGAQPILAAGALLVLGAIALVSRWRRAARGESARTGVPTLVLVASLAIYVIACAINTEIFIVFGLIATLAGVFWFVTAPIVGLSTSAWVLTRPQEERAIVLVQVLGWGSLLVGVGGIATAVALAVSEPLCLS